MFGFVFLLGQVINFTVKLGAFVPLKITLDHFLKNAILDLNFWINSLDNDKIGTDIKGFFYSLIFTFDIEKLK